MKKGISPLVAAVLLIAATMSIAGILAYWASSFVRTALPTMNVTEECQFADFNIYACSKTTDNVTVTLYNYRKVELTGLKLYVLYTNGTISSGQVVIDSLPAGAYKSNTTQIGIPSNEKVKVIISATNCPEVSKETAC